ncbi:MAG: hypothetical protein WAN16_08115 [Chthoniobacterales bacterium]
MKEGILYVATGERFLKEACRSAVRVKELMPSVPIALASDLQGPKELFDHHLAIMEPKYDFSDKIGPLLSTPFERTVFLDTDTWLCEPVPEMFAILDRYDVAMAHAPMRYTAASEAPSTFPECNSGVIAFNMNNRTRGLFDLWQKLYQERLKNNGVVEDQPSLRDALWQSDISFAALPPEYNFRFIMPSFAGRGGVKILHGRHHDYEKITDILNRSGSPRVFLPDVASASPCMFRFLSGPGQFLGRWIALDSWLARCVNTVISGIRYRMRRE